MHYRSSSRWLIAFVWVPAFMMVLGTAADRAEGQCANRWAQRTPAAAPSARDSHAMAYDSIRSVTVLFGGWAGSALSAQTWEWNGTNWSQKFPAAAPSARDRHAMAYDSARTRVNGFSLRGAMIR